MSKYRNVRTEVDGIVFDSKREAARYVELKILKRAGAIPGEIERQVRFPIVVNGVKVCTYVADFRYIDRDGRVNVEDVKGVRTAVYALKAKLMLAVHGVRIVEV